MNVLFLTLNPFQSLNERTIYTDLLRVFVKNNHSVYVVNPHYKGDKRDILVNEDNATILCLYPGNMQSSNLIKKGIATLTIEKRFLNGTLIRETQM